MPMWKIHYQVRGGGYFPLDMLRYDSSYPTDEGQAQREIGYVGERRTLDLCHVTTDRNWKPTDRRWESFTWEVVPNSRNAEKVS